MKLRILATLFLFTAFASASQLTVVSYDMINGGTGSYNYRDFTYSNCPANNCDTSYVPLSGGTGKLTDGVSPAASWYQYGWYTPWVGWQWGAVYNPTVTFHFANAVTIQSVTVWVDNTIGNGGVYLPTGFSVNGNYYAIAPDNGDPNPRAYTLDGLNIIGDSVDVQFFQTPGYWVMVGEVSFNGGAAVPEPMSLALLASGAGVAWWRRHKAA